MHDLADDVIGPAALLSWGERLGIAFYPDLSAKAELVARMIDLASPLESIVVRRPEDALEHAKDEALVIVDPDEPAHAVSFFNQNRDHFEDGPAKILLLLLRGGSGEAALQDAPALASFARQASFEISAPPTRAEALAAFIERYGVAPDTWLVQYRRGERPTPSRTTTSSGKPSRSRRSRDPLDVPPK